MALNLADRLLTIVVTATVTSAAWIVAGGFGVAPDLHPFVGIAPAAPERAVPAGSGTSLAAPAAAGDLIVPVAGVKPEQLSDTFDDARGGGSRKHEALDIMAPAGTPVVAAASGTVEKLFLSKAGGNTIYVRSPDRLTIYYYAHLQDYAPGLREGQAVRPGDVLGKVGSSGDANPAAPHLHFAIMKTTADAKWWEPSKALNPYALLLHNRAATIGRTS
jgi:murein DD-endopeptidase MepM/ murein hydrolase activator NlpD